jgi:hypothetical protein
MEKDTLRMQFLSGVITESEYKEKLKENAAPIFDVVTMDGKTMVGTHQYGVGFKANKKGIEMGFEDNPKSIPNKTKMVKAKSLNESMIGGIVGIGAINQIPPRAKADYETAFEHFLGGKYGLNEEMEVMVDSNMLKSYINKLIELKDDMEYSPEMVDELKNLKNTLEVDKISVEDALDLMQQTVDITEDDIDAVEALSQAVDNDDAIIDKAREIYGLDEVEEPNNY